MVRLAVVRGLTYTDMGQVRMRWLIPTYAAAYRWAGNRADAEDLTAWIWHTFGREFNAPELVQVVEERLAELTADAIVRHWSERYGVAAASLTEPAPTHSRHALESLLSDLTAERHLALVLRFVRRRPIAAIAGQLRVPAREADRLIFLALAQVAERLAFPAPPRFPVQLDQVSTFVTDLVARRRPVRFEARPVTWPVLVAACQVQASIAGNDLPTQRFVRSVESSARRHVTELRIWSA